MTTSRRARTTAYAAAAATLLVAAAGACSSAKKLPNMTGSQLQAAQDEAQSAGFTNLSSEDATGRGRARLWDRNWRVCSQNPKAGEADPETLVVFQVVKKGESCPSSTDGYLAMPGDEMPGYGGRGLMDAMDQMAALTGEVTAVDATGKHRGTDNENDWRVCTTVPAPGETIDQDVRFNVVRNGEKCPAAR
ncbi:hypothetical protein ACF073_00515 [Streptomyces sp. NPDC015171]|uniref:hypothetical protein n=1 Tax=Streptomyces sp. NPDC015171 TaxID=3364945 RepID=UPI0036F77A88